MHARDVVITTTLPLSTTYVGYGWYSSDGQTYTYVIGDIAAGDTGHTITFTVEFTGSKEIGTPEFSMPFTICGDAGGDAQPDDNTAYVYVGVPDLVVTDSIVEPFPLRPDVPVTFTVVLENQGTGPAWNPNVQGGFWVDVFIAPVASYPFIRYSEKGIYEGVPALAPGATYTLVITLTGPFERIREPIQFNQQELKEIHEFYVKVDNHADHPYGLVPESDEMNNLGVPIALRPHRIYTFPVFRQWKSG
jgi:hypothetical protein